MATETSKVKDYLPTEVYAEFERIFENPETFKPKYESGLMDKIGLGKGNPYEDWDESGQDYGSLKFDNRTWMVKWHWGDHVTDKLNYLFLVMYSQCKTNGPALIVSVFNKDQTEIHHYHSYFVYNESVKPPYVMTWLNDAKFDEKMPAFAAFPSNLWKECVSGAAKQEDLKNIRCKLGYAGTSEVVIGKSGGMSFALKVLLGIAALYLVYKISGYVFGSSQKPISPATA